MKRIMAFMLVMMMVLGVTSGCNNSGGDTTSEGPVELLWYVFGASNQAGDMDKVLVKVNEILNEKLNVSLNIQVIDNAAFEDKMTMIINSGESYDMCWTSNWRNRFGPNVQKGAFLEITDEMLKENAPELVAEYPEEYFDFGRVNGKLYAIVNQQAWTTGNAGANVQTAMAEKYNFDVNTPKTWEEFAQFFEQIAQNETGVYPVLPESVKNAYTANRGIESIATVGYINIENPDYVVYPYPGSDYEKEERAFYRQWYDRGIIRNDIVAVTDDAIMSERNTNKYVAEMSANATPESAVTWSNRQGMEYSCVNIAGSKDYAYLPSGAGQGTMTAISINSKHPDKCLQVLNLVNTDEELFNLLVYGIEGEHYTKNADGTVKLIEGAKYNMSQLAWMFGNAFNAYPLEGVDPSYNEKQRETNENAERSPIIGFVFDQEPVANEISQITSVEAEFKNSIYMDNYEQRYEEYLTKMKAAGMDKVIAEAQRQLDAWCEANGIEK